VPVRLDTALGLGCRKSNWPGHFEARFVLQAARLNRLDVDLDLGFMCPRGAFLGERLSTPKAKQVLLGLIAGHLAVDGAQLDACPVRHRQDHAGERKCRYCSDDNQNDCVGSHVGPLDW
jgi:hypothetical protein